MAFVRLSDLEDAFGSWPAARAPRARGLGQAAPPPPTVEVTADTRLQAWLADPEKAPEAEIAGLTLSLDALGDDSSDFVAELKPVKESIDAWRARIQQRRAEVAGLQRASMGEIARFERGAGRPVDLGDMSGVLDSVRKAFSDAGKAVVNPIKQAGRAVDKAVFRPVTKPLQEYVLKPIDRAVFRPVGDAIQEAGRAFDKALIRPITSSKPFEQAIKFPLRKVEKYTLRPAGKEIAKGIAFLDKYVPGWATVLDYIMPVPILSTIAGQLGKVVVKGDVVARLVPNYAATPPGAVANKVVERAFQMAAPVTVPVGKNLVTIAGHPASQFTFTITKGTDTFIRTKGDLIDKLQATAIEALNGFALAISLAVAVAPATAALSALNLAMTTLKSGITVLKAQQAAQELRKQAKAIHDAAMAELARLQAEDAALDEEIRRLKEQIERIRQMRAELEARARAGRPGALPAPVDEDEEDEDDQGAAIGNALMIAVGGLVVLTLVRRWRARRAED